MPRNKYDHPKRTRDIGAGLGKSAYSLEAAANSVAKKDASAQSSHQVTVTARRPVLVAHPQLAEPTPLIVEATVSAHSWEEDADRQKVSLLTSKVYHNTQLDFVGAAARKRFADAFLKS